MKMEVGRVGDWGNQFPLWRPFDGRMEKINMEVGGVVVWGKQLPLWTPFWRFL